VFGNVTGLSHDVTVMVVTVMVVTVMVALTTTPTMQSIGR
jgi:hypothetical protein